MNSPRRTLSTALALVVLTVALPHCARSVMLDAQPLDADLEGGAGPFVSPEGDAAALVDTGKPLAMCATSDCPPPYATCPGQPKYACATNLSNDLQNCGSCGNSCTIPLPPSLHMEMGCLDGECRAVCSPLQYLDCNGVPDDGCEVDPSNDSANCGGCGVRCAPGVKCRDKRCGCPPGTVDCGGECKDLSSDDSNCGACGYDCADHRVDAGPPAPHMSWGCISGHCAEKCETSSTTFWADCNGLVPDGCEINLNGDRNNCGSCGKMCPPAKDCYAVPGGYIDCRDPVGTCPPRQLHCSPFEGDLTCTDIETDPDNCGSCGFACPNPVLVFENVANGTRVCDHARCGYVCLPGFADCNGLLEDGCEAELAKDPRHCGACGVSCDGATGQPCVDSQCAKVECDGGIVQ